jgi:hypothetical protein
MSNATELLKRTLEIWGKSTSFVTDWAKLHAEIRAFLAAEPEAEPVADDLLVKMFEALEAGVPISPNSVFHDWIKKRLSDSKIDPIGWVNKERNLLSWDKLYEDMEPLYLHPPKPEPKRKPLTSNERLKGFIELRDNDDGVHLLSFLAGICFAEKHHKIGDEE